MNNAQHFNILVALINTIACGIGVNAGNYGLAVVNAGVVLIALTLTLIPLQSNPK